MSSIPPPPPRAKKVKHEMELFGDVRIDNYYWLRDDSRSDPQVLSYLHQENDYALSIMSGIKHLQDQIYAEIRGRIKEDDISAPERRGPYYYYERNLEGKEYVQYCRCLASDDSDQPSVYDVMPTGPDSPPEHVILDENLNAQGHQYYNVGTFEVSPNNKLVAYAEDTKGNEIYTVYVIDAESGKPVGKPIVGTTSNVVWAGDEALFYVTMDATLRPDKVWLHKLEEEQSNDLCLYHEKDDMFSVDVEVSESKSYLFVGSESKTTRFIFYFDIVKPDGGLMSLTPRLDGIDTSVSHRGTHFFIKRRSDEFNNSELLVCPVDNVSATTVILPHRESVKIQEMQLFSNHLVVFERENGLPKIIIYNLPPVGESLRRLQGGQAVEFMDPVYAVDPSESQFSSSVLRFSYSSLRTPRTVFDYDMNTGTSVVKKIETVLGGFDSSNYITERQWSTAQDGTHVPMSIVYRKDLVKLDGSDPLLLYGYGSYEYSIDPSFKASRLSLLDRGFIYVIAHVRQQSHSSISSLFSLLTITLQFFVMALVIVLPFIACLIALASAGNFYNDVTVTFGNELSKILNGGRDLTLSLDKYSGSGFQSNNDYLYGRFDMQIKLIPGYSAGTVAAYYQSSQGDAHDEIDFEFLGNVSGQPYTLQTNVYAQGNGNREQRFSLWFDPTTSFHTYSTVWNTQRIIFLVDNIPIRVFSNNEAIGVPFPNSQPMRVYSSLWNADDWATQGGRVKTNWTYAPFTASYRNINIDANCVASSSASCGSKSTNSLNTQAWQTQELNSAGRSLLRQVQQKFMTYNYCTDLARFPQGLPPECKSSKF